MRASSGLSENSASAAAASTQASSNSHPVTVEDTDSRLRLWLLIEQRKEFFILIGLDGLAVMGQNPALNITEKGFPISVYNRTTSKVDEIVERAKAEGDLPLFGFHDPESFVQSLQKTSVKLQLRKQDLKTRLIIS